MKYQHMMMHHLPQYHQYMMMGSLVAITESTEIGTAHSTVDSFESSFGVTHCNCTPPKASGFSLKEFSSRPVYLIYN
jgi:hypothetical protein